MIHYLIHQPCNRNSSGGFYCDLTGDVNATDFTISLILEACSGSTYGWITAIRKTIPALRNIV